VTVFVIGGRGFIGSAFVRYCQRRGLEHACIGREELDCYAGQACDVLINAGGNASKVLAQRNRDLDYIRNFEDVRDLVHRFSCKRWVQLSSCDVYENVSDPSANHEDVNLCHRARSFYGFHKHLAEQYVSQYTGNWLVLRLGGCVGPNLRKNAVYDVLHDRPIWLHPESRLQFMHTDDVARCSFELLEAGPTRTIYNLCGTGTVSVAECIAWAGASATFADNVESLPRVVYEINTRRVRRVCTVPESSTVVRDFIQTGLAESRRQPSPACG
jgi:nucleoside-diphosphate-sugar epimerase